MSKDRAHRLAADRAGGPDGPEPLRVSAKGAHPLRGPSPAFVALTRNPAEVASWPFEPTPKADGDVVI